MSFIHALKVELCPYIHTQKNMGLGFGFGFGYTPKTHTQKTQKIWVKPKTHTQKPKFFGFIPKTHTQKTQKILGLGKNLNFLSIFFEKFDQKIWVFTKLKNYKISSLTAGLNLNCK